MQTIETTKRQYRTKTQKIQLLNELESGGMTISTLARRHGIHPVTIHKWKREMSKEANKDSWASPNLVDTLLSSKTIFFNIVSRTHIAKRRM